MPTPSAQRSEAAPVGFNMAVIAVALALGGIAVAYAIDAVSRGARQPPHRLGAESTVTRTIGDRELEIPLSWFRYAELLVEGFAKQLDLQLAVPLGAGGAIRNIEVTLLPRSRARPSSRLLDGVYIHQFMPDELFGPPGLIGKPLTGKDGFESEAVWYDPLSADPFTAKCTAPVTPDAQPRCLRTVHLGPSIAAVYVFDADVLPNWRRFDDEMQPLLARIGVFSRSPSP
jgi:hypothetical protein